MDDIKAQMKEQINLAASLGKEALVEFKRKNYAEGHEKMISAREAANNFQRLYQSKQSSGATPS